MGGPKETENPLGIVGIIGITPSPPQDRHPFPSNRVVSPVRGKAVPPCARALGKIAAPNRPG